MYNCNRDARWDLHCVTEIVANASAGSFRPEELPNINCEPCYPTDVASYRDLYWAAFALRLQCVAGEQKLGWTEIGTPPITVRPFPFRQSTLLDTPYLQPTITNELCSMLGNRLET